MHQFAHIARPCVTQQPLTRIAVEFLHHLIIFMCVGSQEVFGQQDNVFATLTQRRYGNLYGVDTVEEVFAKASFCHFGMDVCICGAEQAHVNGCNLRAADARDFPTLQCCQQFCLQG